jgi:hypothetical protein
MRQPSFQKLTSGCLVPKGSFSASLPSLQEPESAIVVVSPELPPLAGARQNSYAILQVGASKSSAPAKPDVPAAAKNTQAERWKAMGYDPAQDASAEGWTSKPFETQTPDVKLDLAEVIAGERFDSDCDSSRIPLRLRDMVTEDKNSITFMALCGVSIIGYKAKLVSDAVWRLRNYLQVCVSRGYIDETVYLNDVIEHIRRERLEMKAIDAMETPDELEARVHSARVSQDLCMRRWDTKKAQLEVEAQVAAADLELKYRELRQELDASWNSQRTRTKFDKPSTKLITLKTTAKKMLAAARFEDAERLAVEIREMEAAEAENAAFRMRQAYLASLARLDRKFFNDRESLNRTFAMRLHQIEQAKNRALLPLTRRVDKCTQRMEAFADNQRRNPTEFTTVGQAMVVHEAMAPNFEIGEAGEKLKLPPLQSGKRQAAGARLGAHGSRTASSSGIAAFD